MLFGIHSKSTELRTLDYQEGNVDAYTPNDKDDVLHSLKKDSLYCQIVTKRLSLHDYSGAVSTASKIDGRTLRDSNICQIAYTCGNLSTAQSAIEKISNPETKLSAYYWLKEALKSQPRSSLTDQVEIQIQNLEIQNRLDKNGKKLDLLVVAVAILTVVATLYIFTSGCVKEKS